jgi:undecaprenyl-diphosphatase
MPEWAIAIILGLVEGITEFIPVSSTGHLILAGHLLNFEGDRAATFEIFIQLGAILAIVALYFKRLLRLIPTSLDIGPEQGFTGLRGLMLLATTSLPAFIVALVALDFIKAELFTPATVAMGLAVGGIAILVIEPRVPPTTRHGLDSITWRDAILVGVFQCLALWPGMSRAAMTILGGMIVGLDRKTAAKYSFFAAMPALLVGSLFDVIQSLDVLQASDIPIFGIGFVVAFISALFAVRYFMNLLAKNNLQPFGWYRLIIAGLVVLVLI